MRQNHRNFRQLLTPVHHCQARGGIFSQFTQMSSLHDSIFLLSMHHISWDSFHFLGEVNFKYLLNPLYSLPESECKACYLVDALVWAMPRELQAEFRAQAWCLCHPFLWRAEDTEGGEEDASSQERRNRGALGINLKVSCQD